MVKPSFIDSLCDILNQTNALGDRDAEALKQDFARRGAGAFEDFLLEEGIVSKEQLLEALSTYYEVPCVDVDGYLFDHDLVTQIPKDVLLRNNFIPYEVDGDVLVVVAGIPSDPELPELVGKWVSYDVTCFVGIPRDIDDSIKEFYDTPPTDVSGEDLSPEEEEEEEEEVEDLSKEDEL